MITFLRSVLPFTAYPYVGESIACCLCGSRRKTVISRQDRRWKTLVTVACSDCGLLRTDPMPTDAELERYYREDYRLDYQFAGQRPPRFHVVRSLRDAEDRVRRLADRLVPEARVLDVGCGTGEFLKLARERGCRVTGIEPGAVYARFASGEYGLDVHNVRWNDADLPAAHFDVITCNQVIEHLRDPLAAIAAIARWLKPDGVAFIAVPDLQPNQDPSFERFHFAHIYGFTPVTLALAMQRHGLLPADGKPLDSTVAVFRKADAATLPAVTLRDPKRALALAQGYRHDTVAAHVFGGGYFRHAAQRFRAWWRDTFRPVAARRP